jgi:hypothetical protein
MQDSGETTGQGEVLEWMGTAYGRRKNAEPAATPATPDEKASSTPSPANALILSRGDRFAGTWAATSKRKRAVVAGVGFSTIVIAVALIQVRASASLPDVTQTAAETTADTPDEARQATEPVQTPSVQPSPDQATQAEEARAGFDRAAREAQQQLATEHEARVAAEEKVERLTAELAVQTGNRETAERATAEANAALVTERTARAAAENANRSSQEELARMARTAAAAAIAATPVPQQTVQAETKQPVPKPQSEPTPQAKPAPIEPQSPSWDSTAQVVKASNNVGAGSDVASSALRQGEELFAKGELDAARQRFAQAAKMGMPEAALALGNTYDGVSLAKAGLNLAGDPMRARQWYRRALELAQLQQEPRR